MSIYVILCGNHDSENIADWLLLKSEYFKKLLDLENSIPSADTFLIVFRDIEPEKFMQTFPEWIKNIVSTKNKQIAIDVKAVKSATDKINNRNIPYIVSAFLTDIGGSVAQVKVDNKSNEVTAIPDLLDLLDIKDTIITIDVVGIQEKIVTKIVEKEGHNCLNVKENQKSLFRHINEYFCFALKDKEELIKMWQYETNSFEHGRIENLKYYVLSDISFIRNTTKWKNLNALV